MMRAWLLASSTMPSTSRPSTTLRIIGAVALYRCMITRLAPRTASKLRSISGSRAGVSTWMETSSGIRLSSMSLRTKSNSVCDADGKPISISLKPTRTSVSNMRSLRSASIGSISAWLPSRRSELHHTGGFVSTASGQVRLARRTGATGRYLAAGFLSMDIAVLQGICSDSATPQKETARLRCAERAVDPEICSDVNDQSTRGSPIRDSVMGAKRNVMKMNIAR